MKLTDDQLKQRRKRSIAIACILFALAALFFATTIVRMSQSDETGAVKFESLKRQ